MKGLAISVFFAVLSVASHAQVTGWGLATTNLIYFPYDISKHEVIDTAEVTVRYEAVYPYTDIRQGNALAHDIMVLQIGRNVNKFFSGNLDLLDRKKSFREKTSVLPRQDYVPYIIYTDKDDGSVTTVNRYPFEVDVAYSYMEQTPEIVWQVSDSCDTIADYSCIKATAKFRGRKWTVWFTPEIPLPYGPWKLHGLPGLILKAEDADSVYSFTVKEIHQETSGEITCPEWKYIETTREKWLRHEKSMHRNPYVYFTKGGTFGIFNGWTKEPMDESWTIPYNPIEM